MSQKVGIKLTKYEKGKWELAPGFPIRKTLLTRYLYRTVMYVPVTGTMD